MKFSRKKAYLTFDLYYWPWPWR